MKLMQGKENTGKLPNLKLERETGLEPATTCLEVSEGYFRSYEGAKTSIPKP